MSDCVFCRIVQRQLPATIVAENDAALAFKDSNPQAPVHVLIIPKTHIARVSDLSELTLPLMADLIVMAKQLATQQGLDRDGYRLVINCGPQAGQTVWHLHLHLLGGRAMHWPPG